MEHGFVQIDNELMFSSGPVNLEECRWLRFQTGRQCAESVCSSLLEISEEELLSLAQIPKEYAVPRKNNIHRRLLAARRAAENYLARANKRKSLPRRHLPVRSMEMTRRRETSVSGM